MRCVFTEPTLAALLESSRVDLRAVVLPERVTPDTAGIGTAELPVLGASDRSVLHAPEFRGALESLSPDLIVVACFPWRLPAWLLALPSLGCLNIHPSLLPDGRGADPVFWAFRWGLQETGVTVHRMDAGFDTGPIIASQVVAISDDATIDTLERSLAGIGARLLLETLPAVLDGTADAVPQGGERSRYAPSPQPADLVVTTTWSVFHATRFIRAVAPTYGPIPVLVHGTGQRLLVRDLVQVTDTGVAGHAVRIHGSEAHIRFADGTLVCRLAAIPRPLRLLQRDA
jgi:methionyl-tRNA formyltransferase